MIRLMLPAFCALTRRRIVSALWQVFLQKQLEVREGKDRVLATWIRDVITHDLGRRAAFIDVAPGCARVLISARSRSSHVLAFSSSFKHILRSSPAGAFTEYITRAPIGSVLPASTVAQCFGRDLLVVVLHLPSNSSCRREVGASWTDVAVTLFWGLVVPLPRWPVWLPVRCLWGSWHVWWHSWVVTAACTSTCLWEFSRSRLPEVSMSLWIRLCNHTYIHTYCMHGYARVIACMQHRVGRSGRMSRAFTLRVCIAAMYNHQPVIFK